MLDVYSSQFSARLNLDMATEPSEKQADDQSPGPNEDGLVALSYILAGLLFYGGLGWLGDHFLNTTWLLPVGLIVGLVFSIYLITKRYGSVK